MAAPQAEAIFMARVWAIGKSTLPSKIGGNALISGWPSRRNAVTSEKNVDTTVEEARLEARATKRIRTFMARVWAIGPWRLLIVAAPFRSWGFIKVNLSKGPKVRSA